MEHVHFYNNKFEDMIYLLIADEDINPIDIDLN